MAGRTISRCSTPGTVLVQPDTGWGPRATSSPHTTTPAPAADTEPIPNRTTTSPDLILPVLATALAQNAANQATGVLTTRKSTSSIVYPALS
ncbi:hypothetical protein [Streptomyces sp. GESEQ-35]|uniref:hypothetical protein n=1 Tax=Streptomyces sp. GESEQ-35 TaxID=2812657 RepID=UPI001B319549|nr:hypothetical protein [Streptomyces sp. GESEQ-35]